MNMFRQSLVSSFMILTACGAENSALDVESSTLTAPHRLPTMQTPASAQEIAQGIVEVRETPGRLAGIELFPEVKLGDKMTYQLTINHIYPSRRQTSIHTFLVTNVREDQSFVLERDGAQSHLRSSRGNFVRGYNWLWLDLSVSPEREVIPRFPIHVGQVNSLRPFGFISASRHVHMTPTMEPPTAQTLYIAGRPIETVRVRVQMIEPNGFRLTETTWISPVFGRVQTEVISASEIVSYIETMVRHCRQDICSLDGITR